MSIGVWVVEGQADGPGGDLGLVSADMWEPVLQNIKDKDDPVAMGF